MAWCTQSCEIDAPRSRFLKIKSYSAAANTGSPQTKLTKGAQPTAESDARQINGGGASSNLLPASSRIGQPQSFHPVPRLPLPPPPTSMISPRPALSPSFLAFRSGSPAASPPSSPRLHAPPPLSASFSTVATAAPGHAAASSFYDVLGLRPGASAREIKAAYRRLALAVHPDAAPHPTSSAEDFIRVHAAYSTLSDPDKRADYDRRLLLSGATVRRTVALGRSPSFPAHRSRRTWETDQCW
jgi:hypothetical protein